MKRHICVCLVMVSMLLSVCSTVFGQFGDPVPYRPNEIDGLVNMVRRYCYFSDTDLVVPGRGLGINFTRYYNGASVYRSHLSISNSLGKPWSHSYLWTIQFSGSRTQRYTVYPGKPYSFQSTKNTFAVHIITGRGAKLDFTTSGASLGGEGWESRIKCTPKTGIRGDLALEQFGEEWAYVYTTREGMRYKFSQPTINNVLSKQHVLTGISEPNGNSIKLHYEAAPETPPRSSRPPRLAAIEDSLGRILKFHYGLTIDDVDYPRYITKIEFGVGTPQALTSVYQTVKYGYNFQRVYLSERRGNYLYTTSRFSPHVLLTSVASQLGSDDPRGTEVKTQYEYNYTIQRSGAVYLSAIVAPLGGRIEFEVDDKTHQVDRVRVEEPVNIDGTEGAMLDGRYYWRTNNYEGKFRSHNARSFNASKSHRTTRRSYAYEVYTGQLTKLKYNSSPTVYWAWSYGTDRTLRRALHYDYANDGNRWVFNIYYQGADATHNSRMGNPTTCKQIERNSAVVVREWEADYEPKFNRPIWQMDSMGHRAEFSYDDNLTEQRSIANTGKQPHAVDYDIVTTHEYDSYGNRIKTTFMPGTDQEKVDRAERRHGFRHFYLRLRIAVDADTKDSRRHATADAQLCLRWERQTSESNRWSGYALFPL